MVATDRRGATPSGVGFGAINQAVYNSSNSGVPAHDGSYYAATNTAVSGSSLAQVVTKQTLVGDVYTADVWLRSSDPAKPFSGVLTLWAIGGTTESAQQGFTVGSDWTEVGVDLPITGPGHTSLKFELYELTTAPTTLYVDEAQVF